MSPPLQRQRRSGELDPFILSSFRPMTERDRRLHGQMAPKVVERSWADEVRELYYRSPDMDVAEFEALLDVALRGDRPVHAQLPAYLSLPIEVGR